MSEAVGKGMLSIMYVPLKSEGRFEWWRTLNPVAFMSYIISLEAQAESPRDG